MSTLNEGTSGTLSKDLVLHLDFDGSVTDRSTKGKTATVVGTTPVYVADKDGIDSRALQVGTADPAGAQYVSFVGTKSAKKSLVIWFTPTTVEINTQILDYYANVTNSQGLQIYRDSGGSYVVASKNQTFPIGALSNKPNLIILSHDGMNTKVYLNGVKVATLVAGTMAYKGNANAYLGASMGTDLATISGTPGNVKYDEFREYDRDLTDREALELYREGTNSEGDISSGLIGHYQFNDGDLTDMSGNGRDLVVLGGSKVVVPDSLNEDQNGAVNLFNASYYKTNDAVNPLYGRSEWTISMFMYLGAWQGNEGFLSLQNAGTVTYDSVMASDSSPWMNFHNQKFARPTGLHHFLIERTSDGVMKTYIDNELVATDTITITESADNNLIFGKRYGWYGRYPNAVLDEVRLYDRVLTGPEKFKLYARGINSNVNLNRGLIAKYKFTGGSLNDTSGNGRHLTPSAANGLVATTDMDGVANNAIVTNGGYASVADIFSGCTEGSIVLFFKSPSSGGRGALVSLGNDPIDTLPSLIYQKTSTTSCRTYRQGNYRDTHPVSDGWNCAIIDTKGLIVNGVVVATSGFAIDQTHDLWISTGYGGVPTYTSFDEISVYSRVLNQEEKVAITSRGVNYGSPDLSNSLRAYYRFTGGSLADESGNGRTLQGIIVPAVDKDGVAGNALGVGSQVGLNESLILASGAEPFSITCFLEKNTSSATQIAFGNGSYYHGGCYLQQQSGVLSLICGGTIVEVIAVANLTDGHHYLSVRYTGAYLTVDIDEVRLIDRAPCTLIAPKASYKNFAIGAYNDRSLYPYQSAIDEFRVYGRYITDAENSLIRSMGVSSVVDTTPPSTVVATIDTIGETSANLNVQSSEAGKAYYKVVARDATAPTASEIKSNPTGLSNLNASTTSIVPITNLVVGTSYDAYVVLEDGSGNLQSTATKIQFSTTSDVAPPTSTSSVSLITSSGATLSVTASEAGKAYYKVVASGSTAPTSAEIKASPTGTITTIASTACTSTVAGLADGTSYDLYVTCEDSVGNLQSTATKIQFSTIDSTAPSLVASTSSVAGHSFVLSLTASEAGKAYYKVVASGSTAPTSAEIKASPTGTITTIASTACTFTVRNLAASTSYDVYVTAEDGSGNLKGTPVLVATTTLSVVLPTSIVELSRATAYGCRMKVIASDSGKAYYKVVDSGSTAPTSAGIKANPTGTLNVVSGINQIDIVKMKSGTPYVVYVATENSYGDLQETPSSANITTLLYPSTVITGLSQLATGLSLSNVQVIEEDENGYIYAGGCGLSNGGIKLLRSVDKGATWVDITPASIASYGDWLDLKSNKEGVMIGTIRTSLSDNFSSRVVKLTSNGTIGEIIYTTTLTRQIRFIEYVGNGEWVITTGPANGEGSWYSSVLLLTGNGSSASLVNSTSIACKSPCGISRSTTSGKIYFADREAQLSGSYQVISADSPSGPWNPCGPSDLQYTYSIEAFGGKVYVGSLGSINSDLIARFDEGGSTKTVLLSKNTAGFSQYEGVKDIKVVNSNLIIASLGYSSGDGDLAVTTNGGSTWSILELGSNFEYANLLCVSADGTIYVGTGNSASGDGTIFKTLSAPTTDPDNYITLEESTTKDQTNRTSIDFYATSTKTTKMYYLVKPSTESAPTNSEILASTKTVDLVPSERTLVSIYDLNASSEYKVYALGVATLPQETKSTVICTTVGQATVSVGTPTVSTIPASFGNAYEGETYKMYVSTTNTAPSDADFDDLSKSVHSVVEASKNATISSYYDGSSKVALQSGTTYYAFFKFEGSPIRSVQVTTAIPKTQPTVATSSITSSGASLTITGLRSTSVVKLIVKLASGNPPTGLPEYNSNGVVLPVTGGTATYSISGLASSTSYVAYVYVDDSQNLQYSTNFSTSAETVDLSSVTLPEVYGSKVNFVLTKSTSGSKKIYTAIVEGASSSLTEAQKSIDYVKNASKLIVTSLASGATNATATLDDSKVYSQRTPHSLISILTDSNGIQIGSTVVVTDYIPDWYGPVVSVVVTSSTEYSSTRVVEYTLSRRSKVWMYYDDKSSNPSVATIKSKAYSFYANAGTYQEWINMYTSTLYFHIYVESADYAQKPAGPTTTQVRKVVNDFYVNKLDDLGVDRQYEVGWYGTPSYPVSMRFVMMPARLTGQITANLNDMTASGEVVIKDVPGIVSGTARVRFNGGEFTYNDEDYYIFYQMTDSTGARSTRGVFGTSTSGPITVVDRVYHNSYESMRSRAEVVAEVSHWYNYKNYVQSTVLVRGNSLTTSHLAQLASSGTTGIAGEVISSFTYDVSDSRTHTFLDLVDGETYSYGSVAFAESRDDNGDIPTFLGEVRSFVYHDLPERDEVLDSRLTPIKWFSDPALQPSNSADYFKGTSKLYLYGLEIHMDGRQGSEPIITVISCVNGYREFLAAEVVTNASGKYETRSIDKSGNPAGRLSNITKGLDGSYYGLRWNHSIVPRNVDLVKLDSDFNIVSTVATGIGDETPQLDGSIESGYLYFMRESYGSYSRLMKVSTTSGSISIVRQLSDTTATHFRYIDGLFYFYSREKYTTNIEWYDLATRNFGKIAAMCTQYTESGQISHPMTSGMGILKFNGEVVYVASTNHGDGKVVVASINTHQGSMEFRGVYLEEECARLAGRSDVSVEGPVASVYDVYDSYAGDDSAKIVAKNGYEAIMFVANYATSKELYRNEVRKNNHAFYILTDYTLKSESLSGLGFMKSEGHELTRDVLVLTERNMLAQFIPGISLSTFNPVTEIDIDPVEVASGIMFIDMEVGDVRKLNVSVLPTDATDTSFVASLSDKKVASCKASMSRITLTALAPGSSTLKVRSGDGEVTEYVRVNVVPKRYNLIRVPDPVRNDRYYRAMVETFDELMKLLEISAGNLSYSLSEDKESLLPVARSYGIEDIFKKLPIGKGRLLLRDFPSMVKSKGSEWAVERMAQIYVGMDNIKLEFDYTDRIYMFVNLDYNDSLALDEELMMTLNLAMRHIAPAGKKVGDVAVSSGDHGYVWRPSITESLEARGNYTLASHRMSGLTPRIGDLYGYAMRPYEGYKAIEHRDPDYLESAGTKVIVSAQLLIYETSVSGRLSERGVRLLDLKRIGDGTSPTSSSSIIAASDAD